jgi:hypothetical protein
MKKNPITLYTTAKESVALFRRFLDKKPTRVQGRVFIDTLRNRQRRKGVA